MSNLILASSSPRRKELLGKLSIPFISHSCDVDETVSTSLSPSEIVTVLAKRKAAAVSRQYPQSYIIGSDTIVVSNQLVLGKPKDEKEARQMLRTLSGRVHSVYTGVAVLHDGVEYVFYEKTDVEFWELSEEEIERYIDSGEPFDKAGAYGIQGLGALFVKSISGDYYSVVGLPVSRLARVLAEMGVTPSR
ncbi:Maf family protein [Bacillus sp. FJAT-50079]|uniref:Maf family protein n=1 Tax=Bacillus sp. FJAT-50079 TaxID=2833577 RepID=UPI001BC9E0E0|nr:Maf family protein [Bacillus sp. FJAT-50079]MBS4208958.1 septum formation inhibitor Maf [Bacillus sp. FJAT-50079]